ncbi:YciI family protein [Chakrabartyella piscis]|uniref:YciI family protein n=1 Tax=Chakrabartyella piscis TaxID=2918914 RepID=UPI00295867F5|nr:YciI family protein [Chakrabartyella piscis]
MFIIDLTYTAPLEQLDAVMADHRAFLERNIELGKIICAGRKNPRVGGAIIANVASEEEARALAGEDPFFQNNLAEYTFTDVIVVKYADDFAPFMK